MSLSRHHPHLEQTGAACKVQAANTVMRWLNHLSTQVLVLELMLILEALISLNGARLVTLEATFATAP